MISGLSGEGRGQPEVPKSTESGGDYDFQAVRGDIGLVPVRLEQVTASRSESPANSGFLEGGSGWWPARVKPTGSNFGAPDPCSFICIWLKGP